MLAEMLVPVTPVRRAAAARLSTTAYSPEALNTATLFVNPGISVTRAHHYRKGYRRRRRAASSMQHSHMVNMEPDCQNTLIYT
jgi:hypothetical protein